MKSQNQDISLKAHIMKSLTQTDDAICNDAHEIMKFHDRMYARIQHIP